MKRPNPLELARMVRDWNEAHKEGDCVVVRLDDGSDLHTKTRSEAWLLGGHSPVIMLEKISGCFALSRVKPDLSAGKTTEAASGRGPT